MCWKQAYVTLLLLLIPRNTFSQPGAQQEANRLAQRNPPPQSSMHCVKALSTSRTLRITRHNFTVRQGAADWPVMDGVDSYKQSTKCSNTKVKVEAAGVVWLTMEGLHSRKMLVMLNTSYLVLWAQRALVI